MSKIFKGIKSMIINGTYIVHIKCNKCLDMKILIKKYTCAWYWWIWLRTYFYSSTKTRGYHLIPIWHKKLGHTRGGVRTSVKCLQCHCHTTVATFDRNTLPNVVTCFLKTCLSFSNCLNHLSCCWSIKMLSNKVVSNSIFSILRK